MAKELARVSPDPRDASVAAELAAMQSCWDALKGLSPEAAHRVIAAVTLHPNGPVVEQKTACQCPMCRQEYA